MDGNIQARALVSALAAPTSGSARPEVSGSVSDEAAGFALGTGIFGGHEGEPAPASPPPPPPGQASAQPFPPPSTARSGLRPGAGV